MQTFTIHSPAGEIIAARWLPGVSAAPASPFLLASPAGA